MGVGEQVNAVEAPFTSWDFSREEYSSPFAPVLATVQAEDIPYVLRLQENRELDIPL